MAARLLVGLVTLAAGAYAFRLFRWPGAEAFPVDLSTDLVGYDVGDNVDNFTDTELPDTRGFRNKNPGNIEFSENNDWKGQTGSDGRYSVFSDMKYGIRAIGKVLDSYYYRHGLVTIEQIINRYAPHVENLTDSYISSVVQHTGFTAGEVLAMGSDKPSLVAAIIRHENGSQPFTMSYIRGALEL